MSSQSSYVQYPLAYFRSSVAGWFDIPTVTSDQKNYTIYAASTATKDTRDQQAVILSTGYSSTEFFVVEYRKQSPQYTTDANGKVAYNEDGYERYIYGSGLIIYRINTAQTSNNTSTPYHAYVFRPGDSYDEDGIESGAGNLEESFLSAESGRTSYGIADSAGSLADGAITYSDGTNSGIVISNVGSADGDTITFDITFSAEEENDYWNIVTEQTSQTAFSAESCMDTKGNVYSLIQSTSGNYNLGLYKYDGTSWSQLSTVSAGPQYGIVSYQDQIYMAYIGSDALLRVNYYDGSSWKTLYTSTEKADDLDITADSNGIGVVYADEAKSSVYVLKGSSSGVTKEKVTSSAQYAANVAIGMDGADMVVAYREFNNKDLLKVFYRQSSQGSWSEVNLPALTSGNLDVGLHQDKIYLMKSGSLSDKNAYIYFYDLTDTSSGWQMLGGGAFANCASVPAADLFFSGDDVNIAYMDGATSITCVKHLVNGTWQQLGTNVEMNGISGLHGCYYNGNAYVLYSHDTKHTVLVRSHTLKATVSEEKEENKKTESPSSLSDWRKAELEDGLYTFSCFANSSFVADVSGGSTANGANLQIYTANSSNAQKFYLHHLGDGKYVIYSYASGKAVEVSGSSKTNGGNVRINSYTGAQNQQWRILTDGLGRYAFQAVHSGLVLDVCGGSMKNSSNLQQYGFNNTNAQKFTLLSCNTQPVSDGIYTLMSNIGSGKVLDISGGSVDNRANLQLYQMNGTKAQQVQLSYRPQDGSYTIQCVHSGKVYDVSGGSVSNGANVQQYDSNGSAAQRWIVKSEGNGSYVFFNAGSGKTLTLSRSSGANGTNVYQYDYNGANTQKFTFRDPKTIPGGSDLAITEGIYQISMASKSSMVLDISGGSASAGANAQIYTANGSAAQQFYVHAVGDKTYLLICIASGKVLEAVGSSSGANVRQNAYSGAANQKWKFHQDGNGYYTLVSVSSGLVLDVSGGGTSNGTNVQVYASNASNAQKFTLTACQSQPLEDGIYTIASAVNTGKVLDISGGSKANSANLQLYQFNGSAAQQFRFTWNTDGTYTITCVNSEKVLDVSGGSIKNSANVQQYSSNGSAAQKWILRSQGDGYYTIIALGSGRVLDVKGASSANGTNIQIYDYNGTKAQKFLIE
jgi:hypothetical protein